MVFFVWRGFHVHMLIGSVSHSHTARVGSKQLNSIVGHTTVREEKQTQHMVKMEGREYEDKIKW